jgi:ABC-type nitrate/sulfonate/bicarbonate transport system substrate-binding protein
MKKISILFLFLLIIVVLFSCNKDKTEQVIRYGGQLYPEEFLMKGYDFFSQFGIKVEHILFSSGTENNEALISGSIDVNIGSDSKSIALFNAMGDQALIIAIVQRGNRYSTLVRKDSPYKSWYDLKGKKVGTRFGTGAEFVLRKYFDTLPDLSWEDFQWVNIKTEDMIAALANKHIEAFTVWSPTGEVCEDQGIGRVIKFYGDIALTPVMMHTTRNFFEKNKKLLIKFLAAHLLKVKMIQENIEEAAKYASDASSKYNFLISPNAYKLIFQRIDFSLDFDQKIIDEITETAKFLYDQGQIKSIPKIYWDNSLIQEAMKLIKK